MRHSNISISCVPNKDKNLFAFVPVICRPARHRVSTTSFSPPEEENNNKILGSFHIIIIQTVTR